MQTKLRSNPLPLVKALAETLVITTGAGAVIGGHVAGPAGVKFGACLGLAAGCAILVYWSQLEMDPYAEFALSN